MDGLPRNEAQKINQLLDMFPAILILGVRQCGKTTLSKQIRPAWKYFDLENIADYDLITRDLNFFFKEYPENIIIDEAQEYPELFRQLRGVIDSDRNKKNRFILTGSSSPDLIKYASESLAGRLGIVELGTLKRNELHSMPLPPFYQMFEEEITSDTVDFLKTLKVEDPGDVIDDFLWGGYPEPVLSGGRDLFNTWMNHYFQLYVNRDIKRLFPKLDSIRYRRFVSILSELSGTIINKAQLGRSIDTNEVTVRDYIEIADKTFIWRIIPSYEKSSSRSLVKMPKGIMRDSGLLHFLLNIDNREKLIRSPHVGQNFEAWAIEEIIKGINATKAVHFSYYYYRTKHGVEIDLILEGNFGVLPVEIKFGLNTQTSQISSLKRFVEEHSLPLGIVINNSSEVRMLADKIIQIPAALI